MLNFEKPLYLILLPVIIGAILFISYQGIFYSRFQRKLFTAVRCLVCIFLILAMAGMNIQKYTNQTTTIFAIDLSASTKMQKDAVLDFLQKIKNINKESHSVGIVCFAERAAVELSPQTDWNIDGFHSFVNDSATNIAQGLKLAGAILPEDTKKQIVLLSDGNENAGEAMAQAKLLNGQNIRVDTYFLENNLIEEVQITELLVPQYLNKNVQYDISLKIDSLTDTRGNIKLYKSNVLIANEEINIRAGENSIVFSDISDTGGPILYRAEIMPAADTFSQNNSAYGSSYVEDMPSVLLIENEKSASQAKKLLSSAKVNVTVVEASSAPVAIEQLNLYDAILLLDINAALFPEGFLDALESYVKYTGGGLIVSGGVNSYALGNYQNTPLETILPVDMQLKTDSEMPDLGMVLVIDHSGSMSDSQYGVSRMEMAKEAAIRSMDSLKETDYLGVIVFDSIANWVVPLQKIEGNQKTMKESILKVQPAGGTSILPALKEAYHTLNDANTKLKHIILLTDGQAEQTGYDGLIQNMNGSGITLSTVAIGSGADTGLLERLAKKGNGRYYFTNEFTNLPEIFAKETFLAGKEYINNRTFYPVVEYNSSILSDIENIARIHGYIGTTPKPRADVVLKSDTEEPILATWQYGLGRTVAWMSDMNGRWTQEWLGSWEGAETFRNMVSWAIRKQALQEISVTGTVSGDICRVKIEMPYDETVTSLQAHAISFDNIQYDILLQQIAPGVYEGTMNTAKEGAYILNIIKQHLDDTKETVYSSLNIGYPLEYNIKKMEQGMDFMERIAQTTGGKRIYEPNEVFYETTFDVSTNKKMSNLFIVIGLLLFLIDIALRRFQFITESLELKYSSMIGKKENKKIKKIEPPEDKNTIKQNNTNTVLNDKNTPDKKTNSTASLLAEKKRKREKNS